jgi:hypothetical protein
MSGVRHDFAYRREDRAGRIRTSHLCINCIFSRLVLQLIFPTKDSLSLQKYLCEYGTRREFRKRINGTCLWYETLRRLPVRGVTRVCLFVVTENRSIWKHCCSLQDVYHIIIYVYYFTLFTSLKASIFLFFALLFFCVYDIWNEFCFPYDFTVRKFCERLAYYFPLLTNIR